MAANKNNEGKKRCKKVLRKKQDQPSFPSKLDLDVDTRGQVEQHQLVDGVRRRRLDVDEPGVGAGLELLAGVLVDVRGAEEGVDAASGSFLLLLLRRRRRRFKKR